MDKLQPFLKWAGGKRQLLPQIRKHAPENFKRYFEPFVGAGAVLFDITPKQALINDTNEELINVYNVIKDKEKIELLINHLKTHVNKEEYFYDIRKLDRKDSFNNLADYKKASRFIYLNKTCYNGLYRVNSKGHFNVPFGRYKNPQYVNEAVLRKVHSYLNDNRIEIMNTDFEEAVEGAEAGDFIYLDPPYDPISKTSTFTEYSKGGFNRDEQIRLRDTFIDLYKRGCYVLLSNSNTDFINSIYDYPEFLNIKVNANRSINSNKNGRGKIKEVLIVGDGTKNFKRQSLGKDFQQV